MGTRLHLQLLPGQRRFLAACFEGRVRGQRRKVGYVGGVRSGKTWILPVTATMLAKANPGVPGLAVSPTFPMLEDVLLPEFRRFWNDREIRFTEERGRHNFYLPDVDVTVRCRSAHDPEVLNGQTVGWAVLDEMKLMTKRVMEVLEARVSHPDAPMPTICGATTPDGFDWVYDDFAAPEKAEQRAGKVFMIPGSTRENVFVLRANASYVDDLESSYDPELARQEIEGAFVSIGQGSCYHAFDRARNLKAFDVDPSLPILLGLDFNILDGGWVVSQGDPDRGIPLRAIDEIPVTGADSTNKAAQEFMARYGKHPAGYQAYGDATGQSRKTTGYSDFEAVRAVTGTNVRCLTGNPRNKDRVAAVNGLLLNAKGLVRAYVHPTKCPKLVRDLERVKWEANGYQIDKTDKTITNYSDAWGYLIAFRWPVLADRSTPRRAA